jgi:FkbM family methyltransferase
MRWEEELLRNRKCKIERSAVWKETGKERIFIDCEVPGLSTLLEYRALDGHAISREKGERYKVKTISLVDLLRKHESPKRIDYMSIDTEGSEWDILRDFPFKDYEIGLLTIEHNFNSNRNNIQNLLLANGFIQIYADLSGVEDWLVLASMQ